MFVINIKYEVDYEMIMTVLPEHRSYLQSFYDQNKLVCSGPKKLLDGGFILSMFSDINEVEAFINNDPFKINNLASYSFFEFNPVLHDDAFTKFVK